MSRRLARPVPAAQGRTAGGTRLNASPGLGEQAAKLIAELTGRPFVTAPNKLARRALWTRSPARRRPCAAWRWRCPSSPTTYAGWVWAADRRVAVAFDELAIAI